MAISTICKESSCKNCAARQAALDPGIPQKLAERRFLKYAHGGIVREIAGQALMELSPAEIELRLFNRGFERGSRRRCLTQRV
jgi:hypothetical protein